MTTMSSGTQEFYNPAQARDKEGQWTKSGSFNRSLSGPPAESHAAKAFSDGRYADAAGYYRRAQIGVGGHNRAARYRDREHESRVAAGHAAIQAKAWDSAQHHLKRAVGTADAGSPKRKTAKNMYDIAIKGSKNVSASTEGVEEFFNPYHGPDGRFTSGGGKKLRAAIGSMKSARAAVRSNAAKAGAAKRKGDAGAAGSKAHAAKVYKGRGDSAQAKVREMRAAQIATAKRALMKKTVGDAAKAVPSKKKLDQHSDAVKAAAAKRMASKAKTAAPAKADWPNRPATKSELDAARRRGEAGFRDRKALEKKYAVEDAATAAKAAKPAGGKRHADAVKTINAHKTAKATPDKKDDGPAARNLAKLRQKQIAAAKQKAKASRG